MENHSSNPNILFLLLGISALSLVFLATLFPNHHMERHYLHQNWQLQQAGSDSMISAAVPGCVHLDLLEHGMIEDPFYRMNEHDQQWIDKKDWIYHSVFSPTNSLLEKDQHVLVFEGLDTYADVYLNDSLILEADNFFRSWEVAVTGLLKKGENQLRIYFHSPIKKGLELLKAHGYALPASNDQSENGELGNQKVSIFTRKPGYHYGWDWGPRLVTSGIWKAVRLEGRNKAVLRDVYFQQESLSDAKAQLTAHFEVEAFAGKKAELAVYHGSTLLQSQQIKLSTGLNQAQVSFEINNPQRWWTAELGEPYLYPLKGVLRVGGVEIASKVHHIGLRTIRVVQEPDSAGSSFYFELNGVPVFAKGANYIPNDIFLTRVDDAWYEQVIQSAADANMNMLRVWGGGIYEKEIFYQLCDQKGILVWQDFMFACSMYPGDEALLESIRLEAIDNVRRLRNHPSIAIWCGNNEIDVAWAQFEEERGWGWKQRYNQQQRDEIWQAYDKIFHQILPEVITEHAPDQFYWPSSPYTKEGEHASYTSTVGDMHYWGVWHGEHPFSDFYTYKSRFMSEYGFQSFPEFKTVQKYTLPEDHDIESEVMASHQRSGIGNLRIRSYMEDHYQVPEDFEQLLYVGQILQAEGIKMAIEAHRTAMPYCMGTLYWQLNDCWPVASWAGMDYYLNWKAMHYFVKKAFEPVILAVKPGEQSDEIFVVSDRLEVFEAKLEMNWWDMEKGLLHTASKNIQVPANGSAQLGNVSPEDGPAGFDPQSGVLELRLLREDKLLFRELKYFASAKALKLPADPLFSTAMIKLDDHWEIKLHANKLAKNVFLSFDQAEGFFSDNYFDMLPGESFTLKFKTNKEGDLGRLNIMSLAETIREGA